MNCKQSKRVHKVLDEACEEFRLLSCVTHGWLAELLPVEHETLMKTLSMHRKQFRREDESALVESTLDVLRTLRDSEALEVFHREKDKPSAAMQTVAAVFEELVGFIKQQLGISVEEDNANAANFSVVKKREEEAVSEKKRLEQILKLQRAERERVAETAREKEQTIQTSLASLGKEHEAKSRALSEKTAANRDADHASHVASFSEAETNLSDLKRELETVRVRNEEIESDLRTKRNRLLDDVEGISKKLDLDLDALEPKERELKELCADLHNKLEESNDQLESLIDDRLKHEEAKRRTQEEERKRVHRQKVLDKAASVIQTAWRQYKQKQKPIATSKPKKKSKK